MSDYKIHMSPAPCPDCKGGESYRDCPACEGTGLASDTPLTDALNYDLVWPFMDSSTKRLAKFLLGKHANLERQLAEAERTIKSCYYMAGDLAEAREDTERLDWLFLPVIPKTDKGEDAFATWHCAYTSRQAIDKAMKGQR